jgi:hypothetical protein
MAANPTNSLPSMWNVIERHPSLKLHSRREKQHA